MDVPQCSQLLDRATGVQKTMYSINWTYVGSLIHLRVQYHEETTLRQHPREPGWCRCSMEKLKAEEAVPSCAGGPSHFGTSAGPNRVPSRAMALDGELTEHDLCILFCGDGNPSFRQG